MATYIYTCPEHGEFEVQLKFGSDIPTMWKCPIAVEWDGVGGVFCDERSPRKLTAPVAVIVEGGTGARRGG